MQIIKSTDLKWIKDRETPLQAFLLLIIALIVILSYWKTISVITVDTVYFKALKDRFWEYIYFFHLKPPGLLFKDKLLQLLFPVRYIGKVNFFLLILLNLLGSLGFSSALRWSKVNLPVRFFATSLVFFLSLIFIFWRDGLHYDHFNIFSHLLIISSWASYLKYKNTKSKILISIALSLNVLIYSPGVLLVILTAFLFVFINWRDCKYLSLSILIFIAILSKNYFAHNLIAPSSLSGSTRLTNAYYFYGGYKGLASHIDKNEYPKWWTSCFHYAARNHDEFVGSLYGTCSYENGKKEYNFQHLEKVTSPKAGSDLERVIKRDKEYYSKFPEVFAGPVPEFALGFSVLYGKIASKVWLNIIKITPKAFLEFSRYTFTHYTLQRGSSFFSGLSYEPKYMPLKLPFPNLFQKLLKGIHLLVFTFPFFILISFALDKLEKKNLNFESVLLATGCWASFLSFTGILSLLVCCENDRMYASLYPYLILFGILAIKDFFLLGLRVSSYRKSLQDDA